MSEQENSADLRKGRRAEPQLDFMAGHGGRWLILVVVVLLGAALLVSLFIPGTDGVLSRVQSRLGTDGRSPGGPLAGVFGPAELGATTIFTLTERQVGVRLGSEGSFSVELYSEAGELRGAGNGYSTTALEWSTVSLEDPEGGFVEIHPRNRVDVIADGGRTSVEIPPITLRHARSAGQVAGHAPGALHAEMRLGSEDDDRTDGTETRESPVGADGDFVLDFGPSGVLKGRTPSQLRLTLPGDHVVVLPREVPSVVASLHPGDLSGNLAPYSKVTATLLAEGRTIATGLDVADSAGGFRTWLRDRSGRLVRPQEGMRLVVTDGSDEIDLTIPPLTGRFDLETNELHGAAIANSELGLTVWNPWFPGEYVRPSAEVDPDGAWRHDPGIAINPGTHFYITQPLTDGDEVFYCEQIPLLHITPGSPHVEIETLWDIEAELSLIRAGREIASASGSADRLGRLSLLFRDSARRLVSAVPGDEIVATVSGEVRRVTVLPLEATITAEGRLIGQTEPGVSVSLGIHSPLTTTVASADGRFAFNVRDRTENGSPRSGKLFQAYRVSESGDHSRHLFRGPAIETVLGGDSVDGLVTPNAAVTLTVATGSDSIQVTGRADPAGRFHLELPDGRRVAPSDEVTVTAGRASGRVTVPALTATRSGSRVTGTAPPEELLAVHAFVGSGTEPERLHTAVEDDGTWSVDLQSGDDGAVVDPDRITRLVVEYSHEVHVVQLILESSGTRRPVFIPAASVP